MSGPATVKVTAEVLGETIGEMFDIPYYGVEDQMAESLTLGGDSYETGTTETQAEEFFDPLTGIFD